MVKKLFCTLMVFIFAFAFTMNTSLLAQEEEKVEDVMDISLEDLLDVEITTAGKQAEKIGEVPASVVLVTREDIEKYGYQDLSEVLENIPGLYMTDDLFLKSFGVRGFWTETPQRNVVILVNDIKQTYDLTSGNYLQQINIPVEAIDRIEVVRGPMSVIYGTGAFFGAINIKTNVVEEGKSFNQVSAAAGSEKTYKIFARTAGVSGDFKYSFNAEYFDTEGPDIPMEKIDLIGYTPLTTTKGILESNTKFFNFSGAYKAFTVDASFTEARDESILILPSYSDGTSVINRALRFYFGFDKQLSEKVRLNAKVGFFQNRMSFRYDWLWEDFFGLQEDGTTGMSAELNVFLDPTPKINISMGIDYRNVYEVLNDLNVPPLGLGNSFWNLDDGESMVNQAVYMQLNWKLANRFKLVAGVRLEQTPEYDMVLKIGDTENGVINKTVATYSQTDVEVIPRIALIWGVNDKNYIKLLYGKAINRPSFFQLGDMIFTPGLDPLLPETIQTFEFNYIGTWSPKFSASLSLFYNTLDKLIYRTLFVIGGEVTSRYANVGKVNTTGAEVTLTARPSDRFQLELSGTYQETKDQRSGLEDIEVGYSPKFLGYVKASLFLTKDVSIAVNGTYVDKMQSYYDTTIPGRLGSEVDGYFLLGANMRVRNLFGSGMFLNIRGSNLLDQEIRYPTTSNNSLFATEGTLGSGISFLVTLGYRFIPQP